MAEVAGWVNSMAHGMSDERVIAAFMASLEFQINHESSIQPWLNAAYQLVLQRPADPNGFNFWLALIEQQLAGG